MLFLKKAWVVIKNYWWIPAIAIGIVGAWIVLRKRPDALIEALQFRIKKNQEEQVELDRIHQEEIAARAVAEERAREELERIEREYEETKERLSEERRREVERLLKKDPRKLAKELEDLMGFRVIVVEDEV